MANRDELEALFLAHLTLIDRILAAAARRQGLRDDHGVEFASWAKARLIEGDYAVLRRFRGESALPTYLTVVITMLAREYRVREWGRWRPSAAARARGPLAVRLETLVRRDGLRLDEAAQQLRTAGETALSDRALAALLAELPPRGPTRADRAAPAAVPADAVAGDGAADDELLQHEADGERRTLGALLARALARLPDEDRVMVRLRFWEGLSIADVARALGVLQKPLYRRLERVLGALRADLERAGVSRDALHALFEIPLPERDAAGETGHARPSIPGTDLGEVAT